MIDKVALDADVGSKDVVAESTGHDDPDSDEPVEHFPPEARTDEEKNDDGRDNVQDACKLRFG